MTAELYSKAVVALLREGKDIESVLRGLYALIQKRGDETIYREVLEHVLVDLEHIRDRTTPKVFVASSGDADRLKNEIESSISELGGTREREIKEDTTLVGGYRVFLGDKMIDNSYKRQLIELYRAVSHY